MNGSTWPQVDFSLSTETFEKPPFVLGLLANALSGPVDLEWLPVGRAAGLALMWRRPQMPTCTSRDRKFAPDEILGFSYRAEWMLRVLPVEIL